MQASVVIGGSGNMSSDPERIKVTELVVAVGQTWLERDSGKHVVTSVTPFSVSDAHVELAPLGSSRVHKFTASQLCASPNWRRLPDE